MRAVAGGPGLWAAGSLAVLAVIVGGSIVLGAQLGRPAIPLDPNLPNEQWLIAQGLSGTPGPGQPTRPFAVDRVVAGGAATYVQFHFVGKLPPGVDPNPMLYDDRDHFVDLGGAGGFSPPGWSLALPSWIPWHLPVVQRGYIIMGPLPRGARGAILRFGQGETVRVALNRAALARLRISHPGVAVHAQGLVIRVQAVGDSFITLTFGSDGPDGATPGTDFANPPRLSLATTQGRLLRPAILGSECGGVYGGLACVASWAFPPQRHGTRLMLTVPSVSWAPAWGAPSWQFGPARPGSWRFSFAAP